VCPQGLDVSRYMGAASGLTVDSIDPKWLSSYRMFNRAKIAPLLYSKYSSFQYILFYELDAWVFRDELEYWCDQQYDYIGAPWFDGYSAASPASQFKGVGNGGLSLRKVSSHLRALSTFGYVLEPRKLWAKFLNKLSFRSGVKFLLDLSIRNNTHYLFNDYKQNEDSFWGGIVASKFEWFRVPDMNTAARFSMEMNAPLLYSRNGNQLPFGCHKWEKYHADFWKQFIHLSESGSKIQN